MKNGAVIFLKRISSSATSFMPLRKVAAETPDWTAEVACLEPTVAMKITVAPLRAEAKLATVHPFLYSAFPC